MTDDEFDEDDFDLSVDSHQYGRGGTTGVYNDTSGDSEATTSDTSDEVDPRRLVRPTTLDEIRWYYRNTFAKKLVDKPVEDAFKHGFEVANDPTNSVRTLLDELNYVETYKLAQKKARRDGFSLQLFLLNDTAEGPHVEATRENVRSVEKIRVLTVDDLAHHASAPVVEEQIEGYDRDEYEVREDTGIIVSRKLDETFGEPLGYVYDRGDDIPTDKDRYQFIHASRVQHHTWNEEVDLDRTDDAYGQYEGDSILQPSFHLIKGTFKGNWSVMQTLFRYAAKLYAVNLPSKASKEDKENAEKALQNLNAKSEVFLPDGFEMDDYGTEGQLDPQSYFDVIFDQICASNEMTKSVLFGTQSGTVTGSETDIKNYFNKVERLRQNRFAADIREFVTMVSGWDQGAVPNLSLGYEIEWGPLFKLSEAERIEMVRTLADSLGTMISNFVLTPDEARNVLKQQWAEVDVDLEDLNDEQKQWLEEINLSKTGAGSLEAQEQNPRENPQQHNGGGRESGQTNATSQPSRTTSRSD